MEFWQNVAGRYDIIVKDRKLIAYHSMYLKKRLTLDHQEYRSTITKAEDNEPTWFSKF